MDFNISIKWIIFTYLGWYCGGFMNTNYDIIDNYGYDNYDYLYEVIDYTIKKNLYYIKIYSF